MPGHLRYQACNDTTCFTPKVVDAAWTLRVAPGKGKPQQAAVFERIAFGTGDPPSASVAPTAVVLTDLNNTANAGGTGADATLDDFSVLASDGGYMGSDRFLEFIRNAEAGVKEPGLFDGRGPLAILLIVFLGGLALNLTPCVLPMIPINLAIIGAGANAGHEAVVSCSGRSYGAAMAIVYGVLGLVVILTAGTFGTINSSPWFNLAIALLFIVLGLAMFDVHADRLFAVFDADCTAAANRGSVTLAFGMGAVAALLAGACVAPVVIQVVLFSSNLYATGTKSRWPCRSAWASAWRFPGRLPVRGIAAAAKTG